MKRNIKDYPRLGSLCEIGHKKCIILNNIKFKFYLDNTLENNEFEKVKFLYYEKKLADKALKIYNKFCDDLYDLNNKIDSTHLFRSVDEIKNTFLNDIQNVLKEYMKLYKPTF